MSNPADHSYSDPIGGAREAMLQRLEAIFSRATPGPWRSYQNGVHPVDVGGMGSGKDFAICTHGPDGYANAMWIAAISNDWPMVIELIRELSGTGGRDENGHG
jgi:hypothetical protein